MTIAFNDLEKLRDRSLRETMRQRTPVRPPDRKTDKTGEMESCTRDPKREWPNFTDRKDQRADRLT